MTNKVKNFKKLNAGLTVYNFMRWDYCAFSFSGFLLITSIAIIAVQGFNWGLDFTGGTVMELYLKKAVNIDQMRTTLNNTGLTNLVIQNFGSSHNILIRIPIEKKILNQEVSNKILEVLNRDSSHNTAINRLEFIGPTIGVDLVQDGEIALLIALISIFIYVALRFEWRLATGAVLALIHDVIITLGVLSLFYIEIDLTIIAALMSIMGYSLNDSIVVSDRIRENFRKMRYGSAYDIFNISLTQTLSRTIMTSMTILMVVIILLIFGGSMLHGFSTTLFIGVFIGTISSIYVAAPIALKLGLKHQNFLYKTIKEEND